MFARKKRFLVVLLMTLAASCGQRIDRGNVTSKGPHVDRVPAEFDGDVQGGVEQTTDSADYAMPRVAVGGSYSRTTVSSAHFLVTGGISGAR